MEAIKIYTNKNTKKLHGKLSSVEGKTTGQIHSIHYDKIDITTLKLLGHMWKVLETYVM